MLMTRGARRKRANQWEHPDSIARLNPLGQRIRETMLMRGWGPSEFREAAGITARTAVDSLLSRLGPEVESSNVSMEMIVALARAGRVSLVWLATGEGDMLAGPFASDDTASDMEGMPEELVRATRAAMAITGCTSERALAAARQAWEQPRQPGEHMSVDDWLVLVRGFIRMSGSGSGVRPSVRALRIERPDRPGVGT